MDGTGSLAWDLRLARWAGGLGDFVELVDQGRWTRRISQLRRDAERSSLEAKPVLDYHWLELELELHYRNVVSSGRLERARIDATAVAALEFATSVADLSARLTPRQHPRLLGRLHDGLNSGFASIFQELDLARTFELAGWRVHHPELEGFGTYDLLAQKDNSEIAVECKTLSPDAGRKIHRRPFYSLMKTLEPTLASPDLAHDRICVVTLADRLSVSTQSHRRLAVDIAAVLGDPAMSIDREEYSVVSENFDRLEAEIDRRSGDLSAACHELFGPNPHVAGALTPSIRRLVVLRSRIADDPSKAALAARSAAARQLPLNRPGLVAIQYEDIAPVDLSRPMFRRTLELLDGFFFRAGDMRTVSAIYHSAYRGLHESAGMTAKPGLLAWNPKALPGFDHEALGSALSYPDFVSILSD